MVTIWRVAIMKAAFVGLLVSLLGAGGCIVRTAAETVLAVKQPDNCPNKSVMGLGDVIWCTTEDKLSIVGYGWHPREHETYAFFICEPYPTYQPRYIRITSENNDSKGVRSWRVELLVHVSLLPCEADSLDYTRDLLYVGTTSSRVRTFFGKLFLNLRDLKLTRADKPTEAIIVRGRVVARKSSSEEFISMVNMFDLECQPDPYKNPIFILEEDAVEFFGVSKSVLSEVMGEEREIWSCGTERGRLYRKEDIQRLLRKRGKLK